MSTIFTAHMPPWGYMKATFSKIRRNSKYHDAFFQKVYTGPLMQQMFAFGCPLSIFDIICVVGTP